MDLLNLFKQNQNFERVTVQRKLANYPSNVDSSAVSVTSNPVRSPSTGKDYVKKYLEEENERALQAARSAFQTTEGAMDELSVGTVPLASDVGNEETAKVFSTYNFEHRPKDDLPIVHSKEEIVSTIQTHAATIIEGVTGCGKSTQVPQFILDSCKNQRKHCNIIVTQPRRIAALSIASRVCKERNWQLGSLVGVQVGMYRNISSDTRLTYCTTGVLLRKLIKAKNMNDYTHIILDEVHERDQEMDFLLLVIRKFLRGSSRQVKVVLMSATFNVKKFANYFSTPTETGFHPAPIITIPKKRNFKVHNYYLCQLESLGTLPEISPFEPKVTEKMMRFCVKLINVFDQIDSKSEYDADDLEEYNDENPRHATLIFLPGIWEIEEMHNLMTVSDVEKKWDIVILHSSITSDEQSKIFSIPPRGTRRIILSTNLAESSITIHDVKYVIDFCLTKQLVTDPVTNFNCLELTWASKANCEQRAGRAGRVMDGRVYRLVPKVFYENHLQPECDPEIIRAPLENLVLQAKILDMGEPKAVLALAIDPPDLTNLERTVLLLKEAGGLIDKPNVICKFDGELTDLGRIMAQLPIEVHLSKLIALGHVFNVFRDAIIMAACMSLKSMFNNPFQKHMEAYVARVHWADGSTSDCLAFLNAYTVWRQLIQTNRLKKKSHSERSWANRNFIQIKVMHEVDHLVAELTSRLENNLGIKETTGPNKVVMDDIDRAFILKVVIAGAFYPNYFVRNRVLTLLEDKTGGSRDLGGFDPTRTIYLQGWNPEHCGRLYAKRIQNVFECVTTSYDQTIVEFDGSTRVYVIFPDDRVYGNEKQPTQIPGKVSLSVYKALKMRKAKIPIVINTLDPISSKRLAEDLKISSNTCSTFYNDDNYKVLREYLPKICPNLPPLDVSTISIKVVNFQNPNEFWVHHDDPATYQNLSIINDFLDPTNQMLKPVSEAPKIGSLVVAYDQQNKMCRAVIESYYKLKNEDIARVYYIDYGTRNSVRVSDLKLIPKDHKIYTMPALAFKCTLSNVKPSHKIDAKGLWTKKALDLFKNYVLDYYKIFGVIYSIVDSVVSLQMICTHQKDSENSINLNDLMIKQGLADFVEESYLSKYNHQIRVQVTQTETLSHRQYLEYLQYDRNFLINSYPTPPPLEDCRFSVVLRGPFSPLELTFSSLATRAATKTVSIEGNSVNSVLLDTDPDDPHERLLVSSVVSQNQSGSCLNLRNTTLMPNIPGLTALICLIFSPKIELRRSSQGTYYTGALCGLGYDTRTCAALLPEHDMDVLFDTEFTFEDMQNINGVRHYMNMGICVKSGDVDDLDEQAIICQVKVHEFFKNLMDRPLKRQKPEKILCTDKWCRYDDFLFLSPKSKVVKEDSIYPLHRALQLELRDENKENMTDHMHELRELAISDPRLPENIEITCKLCDVVVFGREALRIHLFMPNHRNREKVLSMKNVV